MRSASAYAIGSILLLGALRWISSACGSAWLSGHLTSLSHAQTLAAFERSVFQTGGGWAMIAEGFGAGFLFAVLAFALSVVSYPLLLDRDVGVTRAISTSLRAVAANAGVMTLWGAIVATALLLGSIPALVGLIFVVPLLGHASWHLYRKLIA